MTTKKFGKMNRIKANIESALDNLNIKSKHTWLNSDNLVNCRSDEYFKDISYFIDLQHLYKVVDTCYYHADMPLIPVLLKIQAQRIQEAYQGAPYLLQIWDARSKQRVFQKPLNSPIKYWNVTFEYLMFIIENDESPQIHILRFQDFQQCIIKGAPSPNQVKHLSFIDKFFIVVTQQNEIHIYHKVRNLIKRGAQVIDVKDLKYKDQYQCDLSVLGLLIEEQDIIVDFYPKKYHRLIIVFETQQNKLDFNILDLNKDTKSYGEKRIFNEFQQLRDIYPRQGHYRNDPINKVVFRFHHKYFKNNKKESLLYACSLRESGIIDLYSNMLHKQEVTETRFKDIGMSLTHFYFETWTGTFYNLKHIESSILSYESSEAITDDSFTISGISYKIIERYAHFYKTFQLLMFDEKTFCLVVHQNFISVFDIIGWKWVNHIQFETDVQDLFFQKKDPYAASSYVSCAILKNGDIFYDLTQYFYSGETVTSLQRNEVIPKPCTKFLETSDNSDDDGEVHFIAYSQDNDDVYIIMNCKIYTTKALFNEKVNVGYNWDRKLIQLQIHDDQPSNEIQFIGIDGYNLTLFKLNNSGEPTLKRDPNELVTIYDSSRESILNLGHTAIKTSNNYIIFERHSAFIIDPKTRSIQEVKEVHCQSLLIFNKNVNYGTFFESAKQPFSGLKMIDIDELSQNKEIRLTLLKQMDIGGYGKVYFDNEISRICFVESLKNIIVHPYLHMNTNKFINMKNPMDYICFRTINHKLVAFKQKGELVSWDVLTGKYFKSVSATSKDLSDFEVFQNNTENPLYQMHRRVLLVSKFDVEGCSDANYFTKDQLDTSTKDQIPLISFTKHAYKQFILLEIISPDQIEVKLDFIFPKFEQQQMFINSSCDRMIVRLEFQRVFLYKTKGYKTTGISEKTIPQWELLRQITDYPYFFDNEKTEKLEPFTEDMSLYIRYGKKAKAFFIKHTDTGENVSVIPNDIMTIGEEDAIQIINRFRWLDNERILIVNAQGIEKIINIRMNFKEEAFNSRPLFNEITGVEWKDWPYYVKRSNLKKDTLSRLKRMYQEYKSMYFLYNYQTPEEFYEVLFRVDQHNINLFEHSFTFLHWSIMDQFTRKTIKIKELKPAGMEPMIYNILPGGNTLLHKVYKSQEKIAKIFKLCHTDDEIKVHIPYLLNMDKLSSIDLSLSLGQKDYKSIFSVLNYLQLYPMDHHSRTIKSCYHVIIEQQLPEFLDYLDSRFQQTDQMKQFDKGQIENEYTTSSMWIQEKKIKDKLLSKIESEAKIKLEILDMPDVYHYQDADFVRIFKQLAALDNFKFFENRAIKTLIDFNYPIARSFLLTLLIVPFCVFHIIFVVYMNVVYEYRTEQEYETANYVLSIIQLVFCAYFLFNEFRQIVNLGVQYLTSVWNYIDLIAPSGVIVLHGFQFAEYAGKDLSPNLVRSILSIATFFMWLKFLSSLRIFKSTGYLIRMIIEVIWDMGIFLFILLITVMAFGDAFYKISNGNDPSDQFITDFFNGVAFAYAMILGGFDTSAFGVVAVPLVWIFWVICTVLDMIVMLNLLIAIISSTFGKVNDNADLDKQIC